MTDAEIDELIEQLMDERAMLDSLPTDVLAILLRRVRQRRSEIASALVTNFQIVNILKDPTAQTTD